MTSQRNSSPWFTMFLGLAILGGGGGLAWYGQGQVDLALQSVEWPQVPGVVLSSEIESTRQKGKLKYWAAVSYEFEVKGEKYSGSTISFDSHRSSQRHDFEKVIAKYPVGKEVPVYYDANKPENNVLQPGITFGTRVPQFLGFVLMGVGLLIAGYPLISWAMSSHEPPEVMSPEEMPSA
jgi:hypothetical protein